MSTFVNFVFLMLILPLTTLAQDNNKMEGPCVRSVQTTTNTAFECYIEVNAEVNPRKTILVFMHVVNVDSFTLSLRAESNTTQALSVEVYNNQTQTRVIQNDGTYQQPGVMAAYDKITNPLDKKVFFRLRLDGTNTNWTPKFKLNQESWSSTNSVLYNFGNLGQQLRFFISANTKYQIERTFSCTKM